MPRPRVLLISLGLLLAVLAFRQPVRQTTLTVLRAPFTLTKHVVRVLVLLPQLPGLARENVELRGQLMQRQLEVAQLREGLRHAAAAAALVQAVPATPGTVSTVIGRSPVPTEQTVLLDRGQQDGVRADSIVVDATGVVGRVIEVQGRSSLSLLITDSESRIAAMVERSRETGLLVGAGQGVCHLIYLDSQADVQDGDRVITAGLGGPFPKGLPLGVISRVQRNEEQGVAEARVIPAAQLGRLEEVLCLPPVASMERVAGSRGP